MEWNQESAEQFSEFVRYLMRSVSCRSPIGLRYPVSYVYHLVINHMDRSLIQFHACLDFFAEKSSCPRNHRPVSSSSGYLFEIQPNTNHNNVISSSITWKQLIDHCSHRRINSDAATRTPCIVLIYVFIKCINLANNHLLTNKYRYEICINLLYYRICLFSLFFKSGFISAVFKNFILYVIAVEFFYSRLTGI